MDITAKTAFPAKRGMAFGESRFLCGTNMIMTTPTHEAA